MSCIGCQESTGLGQLDPATLFAINEAFVHAKDLWEDILNIFGIGAGAREADVVVPVQNQLVETVIAPVSDFLTKVNTGEITPSCVQLQTWQSQIISAEKKWLDYLHKTEWQDGRAAQQAEATLAPYFTNAKQDLQKYIDQYCKGTIGGIFTTPEGTINWPVIGIGAGIVYLATRRK